MSEILIVGINSFLGRAIYDLLKTDHHIVGVYHRNIDNLPNEADCIQIQDLKTVIHVDFCCIYLVSAFVPKDYSEKSTERLFQANVELPEIISAYFPRAKILYCSSVSVYEGLQNTLQICEGTAVSPVTPYAISKLWGEKVIKNHASWGIIRISSMYGIGMKEETFIPRVVQRALYRQEITLLGNGSRLQNYIHVTDVARMAISVCEMKKNGIWLAVDTKSYSNLELAQLIQRYTGAKIKFSGEDFSKSYVYNSEYLADFQLKQIDLGIKEYIEWKRKQY